MTQIQITNIKRYSSYTEISYKMSFVLPAILGTGAAPINGLDIILSSYPEGFSSEIIVPEGTVIVLNETVSLEDSLNLNQVKNKLVNKYTQIRTKLDAVTLKPYDVLAGLTYNGTTWI